ncbi:DUF2690 domain-containing protein [Actinomadura namibiensis]|uniref:DUF2690 domain-containing protein n=1 Tax=Actinomadura namibiensis TaxID=182080 RepID=A0A7W3LSI3_ACTNM|nr:DUF2690 domain-containing protein [Actinomadura namibiensis]MBA8953523.1 hypothetical protein [Actinomadura namibiensis]
MQHTPPFGVASPFLAAGALAAVLTGCGGDGGGSSGGGSCRGDRCVGQSPVTTRCADSGRRLETRDIDRNTGDPETSHRVATAELWRSRRCGSAWIRIVNRDGAASAEDVAAAAMLVWLRWREVPATRGQDLSGFTAGWEVHSRVRVGGREGGGGERWSTMIGTARRGDRFQMCVHDLFHRDDGEAPVAGSWDCTPRGQG